MTSDVASTGDHALQTRLWLAATLPLTRVGTTTLDGLPTYGPLLRALSERRGKVPPANVVVDLSRLLSRSHDLERAALDPRWRQVRRYHDHVLGRLVTHPLFRTLTDTLASRSGNTRLNAITTFIHLLLDRLAYDVGFAADPGTMRMLDRTSAASWEEIIDGHDLDEFHASIESEHQHLVDGALRSASLIQASDIVLLEQLDHLPQPSDRLAFRMLLEAAEQLVIELPPRFRATRRRAGHISSRLVDENRYPVGGFSSISNKGSPENLVTSELALMEDGNEVDLFDVRWAEGELLYYTRDETAFVRPRRRLTVTLPPLSGLHFRDPDLPVQRWLLVLGWIRAFVVRLADALSAQDLLIRICLASEDQQEASLMRLALADGVAAGWIDVRTGVDIAKHLIADARRAPTDWLAVVLDGSAVVPPDHVWSTTLTADRYPILQGAFTSPPRPEEQPLDSWRSTLRSALEAMC